MRIALAATGRRRGSPEIRYPGGVRRSQVAFLRDLPELLKDETLRGKWIGYHAGERIGIASSEEA